MFLQILLILTLTVSAPARAADPMCPDAGVFSGKLITDICWSCLFPIKVGAFVMGGGNTPPSNASSDTFCMCQDNLGVPHFGLAVGLWEPARMVELVRKPGCSPTLGGMTFPFGQMRLIGTEGKTEYDNSEVSFYNYHYYAFPLLMLLDMFFDNGCNADGYSDFDILYLSEFDPTWNDDELAFFTNPEAVWTSDPVAQAACLGDAVMSTAEDPQDPLFWCAGAWGSLYPFTGIVNSYGSNPDHTSLAAARVLAALHRRGLSWRTAGADTMCRGKIDPMLPKTQYRLSMFYPVAETQDNHVIGQSTFTWGIWRTIPGPGEDHIYIIWRWNDCCATF